MVWVRPEAPVAVGVGSGDKRSWIHFLQGLFEPVYFSPILDRPVGQPNRTLNGYAFGSFKTEELGTAGLVGLKPALLKPRGVRVALII
jgi:hypothetical protein